MNKLLPVFFQMSKRVLILMMIVFTCWTVRGQSEEDPSCYCFKCYAATTLDLEKSYQYDQVTKSVLSVSDECVQPVFIQMLFCDNGILSLHGEDGKALAEYKYTDNSYLYDKPKGTICTLFDFIGDEDYTMEVSDNLYSNLDAEVIISIYPRDYEGGKPSEKQKHFHWFCRLMR